jgi:hypothetical protein
LLAVGDHQQLPPVLDSHLYATGGSANEWHERGKQLYRSIVKVSVLDEAVEEHWANGTRGVCTAADVLESKCSQA